MNVAVNTSWASSEGNVWTVVANLSEKGLVGVVRSLADQPYRKLWDEGVVYWWRPEAFVDLCPVHPS